MCIDFYIQRKIKRYIKKDIICKRFKNENVMEFMYSVLFKEMQTFHLFARDSIIIKVFPLCICVFISGFFPPMQPLMIMDYLGLDQLTAGFGFVTMLKAPAAFIGPPFAGLPFAAFTIVSKIKANKKSMLYALIINKHRTYKGACILIKLEFGIWGLSFYRNHQWRRVLVIELSYMR